MAILAPEGSPFDNVERLGLVIQATDFGLHTGFLYLTDEGPRICHLAFHHQLVDQDATPEYRWADIDLDLDNKIILANLVALIAHEKPNIPYGFNLEGVAFDPSTGKLIDPPVGKGLTCATFILAVFRTFSIPLLAEETWVPRESDVEWQNSIISLLERRAAHEHIEAVQQSRAAPRFRPDEVVGCASSDERPVKMEDAEILAKQIREDLAASRSSQTDAEGSGSTTPN